MARFKRKVALTLSVAGVSLFSISAADAQTNSSTGTQEPGAGPATDQVEDIVVTARRRDESLQRTPISVVALSTDALEQRSITNLRSLQNFVPNVTFAPSQNVGEAAGNMFIRGIGQEDFVAGSEPGVGVYFDGVYIARTSGNLMDVTDIERVEVLRGPQGTLYGKNTIGGAINIISVLPQSEAEGRFSALGGNFNRVELHGMLNAPLSQNFFVRLAVRTTDRAGYLTRLAPPNILAAGQQTDEGKEGNDHSQSARLQTRWLANETLTVDLSLDGSRRRNNQGAIYIDEFNPNGGVYPIINQLIALGKLPGPLLTKSLFPTNHYQSYAGGNNFVHQDIWGLSGTVTQEVGPNTLKAIVAYRHLRNDIGTDPDGLYFDIVPNEFRERQHQISGELQWNGETGGLTYTAGLFGFKESADSLPPTTGGQLFQVLITCGCFYPTPPATTVSQNQITSSSYAAYAQGTYKITDQLSATLGARYSFERKSIASQIIRQDANLQPTGVVAASASNKDDWDAFTYRVGLEYQATSDVMLYAATARGYKSGGFNARPSVALPNLGLLPFKPEESQMYELGVRTEWFEHKVRLNATIFHSKYQDIQLRRQAIVGGVVATLIENAAEARINGAEVEFETTPTAGLTLSAAYGYLDPKYLDVGGVPGLTLDSKFQRTASHSLTASADYQHEISLGSIEFHVDFSYRSKEQFQLTASPYDQDGYGLLGARITLRTADDRYSVALFGTNLTDKFYRTAGRYSFINSTGFAYSSVGQPRLYGVQVTARF